MGKVTKELLELEDYEQLSIPTGEIPEPERVIKTLELPTEEPKKKRGRPKGSKKAPAKKRKKTAGKRMKKSSAGIDLHALPDPGTTITQYDRFQADLNWISESNARAYESIQYAIVEMRRKDRKINELLMLLGEQGVYPDSMPYVDPPKDDEIPEMIPIEGKNLDRLGSSMIALVVVYNLYGS